MFTGIVEELGVLKKIAEMQDIYQYQIIASPSFVQSLNNGDSISVNGVCLTACDVSTDSFNVDVSQETQSCTTFANIKNPADVNLERAITASTRLGGHFVSGHIDSTARLLERTDHENETILWIDTPSDLYRYIAVKGSICINGVSLTVNQIEKDRHCITLIPHTLKHTNLSKLQVNDMVNIEVDLVARYLEQLSKGT